MFEQQVKQPNHAHAGTNLLSQPAQKAATPTNSFPKSIFASSLAWQHLFVHSAQHDANAMPQPAASIFAIIPSFN
jgi:hypothetical protein